MLGHLRIHPLIMYGVVTLEEWRHSDEVLIKYGVLAFKDTLSYYILRRKNL